MVQKKIECTVHSCTGLGTTFVTPKCHDGKWKKIRIEAARGYNDIHRSGVIKCWLE